MDLLANLATRAQSLKARTEALTSKQTIFAAMLLGSISTLAMAPVFMWPVMFLTMPLLLWMIDGQQTHKETTGERRQTRKFARLFFIGWSFGFGYFLISLYWIGSSFLVEADKFAIFLPFAVTLMPAGLALFYGLAFAATGLYWPKGPVRLIAFAIVIFAADWLRGHILTGFPWNLLGHSLTGSDALMQSLTIFDIYGLSAVAILIFASPALLAFPISQTAPTPFKWLHFSPIIAAALVLIALYSYGSMRLSAAGPTQFVEQLELALIQPNIPQIEKVKPELRSKALRQVIKLTESLRPSKAPKRLIIWPETAVPFALKKSEAILQKIAEILQPSEELITGAYHVTTTNQQNGVPQQRVFNSLFIINDKGIITGQFDKNHLVPFGEYLPMPSLLSAIGFGALVNQRGGFHKGKKPVAIVANHAPPFLPFICYEAIFPLSAKTSEKGARWLLNISNDGWFGNTAGPYQHAHMVRLRSVETGLPMVRIVNSGITAVYDSYGRSVVQSELGTTQILYSKLPLSITPPLTDVQKYIMLFGLFLLMAGLFSTMKFFDKQN